MKEGGVNMSEEFAWVACGDVHEKDDILAPQDCRVCRRLHCDGSFEDSGVWLECRDLVA